MINMMCEICNDRYYDNSGHYYICNCKNTIVVWCFVCAENNQMWQYGKMPICSKCNSIFNCVFDVEKDIIDLCKEVGVSIAEINVKQIINEYENCNDGYLLNLSYHNKLELRRIVEKYTWAEILGKLDKKL